MSSALGRPDAVHKGHTELLVRRTVGDRNVPALVRSLVDYRIAPKRLRILGQVLTLDGRLVEGNLHLLPQRHGQIVDATLDELTHSLVDLRHAEASKVGSPVYTDVGLLLARLDDRLSNLSHVLLERLSIDQASGLIHDRHNHLFGKDIDQLDAVAILSADQLLLLRVVVRRGQELTEDHLGDPRLVLRVFGDVDRLSIVRDGEGVRIARDVDALDRGGRILLPQPHDLVVGVDDQLIDELVETRVDGNLAECEPILSMQVDLILCSLDTADVGVWKAENVLAVGLLHVGSAKVRHLS